jgi:hypothetical protein
VSEGDGRPKMDRLHTTLDHFENANAVVPLNSHRLMPLLTKSKVPWKFSLFCNNTAQKCTLLLTFKTRQAIYYNVTLRLFHATTVSVEKQSALHILSVCL